MSLSLLDRTQRPRFVTEELFNSIDNSKQRSFVSLQPRPCRMKAVVSCRCPNISCIFSFYIFYSHACAAAGGLECKLTHCLSTKVKATCDVDLQAVTSSRSENHTEQSFAWKYRVHMVKIYK